MKYLYGLFALIAAVGLWTQWISPLQGTVIEIAKTPAASQIKQFESIKKTLSRPAIENDWLSYFAQEPTVADIEKYSFVTYSVKINNWRLRSISNLQTRLIPPDHGKQHFLVQIKEAVHRSVEGVGHTTIVCQVLLKTDGLSTDQINEIVNSSTIEVSWDDLSGQRQIDIHPM